MNPHRCKILCDKPFESPLCHRNDTAEHIATRRKAILPRRKVIRAMPSEPFVSTASYAVCPHPLRYGPALSYPTPRPVSFGSFPALPDGAQIVPATAARTNRLFPAAALRARTPARTPYTRPEQERRPASEPHRPKYEHHPEPKRRPEHETLPKHETPARTQKTCPKGARPSGQACAAW